MLDWIQIVIGVVAIVLPEGACFVAPLVQYS